MIDIETLTGTFGGDKEFVTMIFTQYLSDNSDINQRIQTQFEAQQFETLFHTMHTLSGSLANICEIDIVPTIKKVEGVSKAGELAKVDEIDQIKEALDKIKQQMEQYIA